MECEMIDTRLKTRFDVCLIFNELGEYKKSIYCIIKEELNARGYNVDLMVYHCNQEIFSRLLHKFLNRYAHFVIIPFFTEEPTDQTIRLINEIPERKLIFLTEDFKPIRHSQYGAIIQDHENDLFQALNTSIHKIKKYNRFILVFPTKVQYPYPSSIVDGFAKFCSLHMVDFMVVEDMNGLEMVPGDLYLVVDDADLADLVKLCRGKSLTIGEHIGVISYNQTPLKEILENGISVVSGDFHQMAKRAVEMIVTGDLKIEKNPFSLIEYNSF